jgi:hypothetical protein
MFDTPVCVNIVDAMVLIILIYTLRSYLKKKINNFISFFFQGDFENSKGQTRGKPRHVGKDVQKSVEEDVKRNEHNCVARRTIPTTMCIRGM